MVFEKFTSAYLFQIAPEKSCDYLLLYNNKINARVLIGQSAMVYWAGKPMEKTRVFWIII